MHAAAGFDRRGVIKQIHQHGLPASGRAVDIEPLWAVGLRTGCPQQPGQAVQDRDRFLCFLKDDMKGLQPVDHMFLPRIGRYVVGRHAGPVGV